MKQITESYVSFETAQLLKEKGFDEYTLGFYKDNNKKLDFDRFADDWNIKHVGYIAAPTLQMAMKWLREVHNIYINVLLLELKDGDYGYVIEDTISRDYLVTSRDDSYQSPEEAAEAALLYVLKNLI